MDGKLAVFVYLLMASLIMLPLMKPGYYLALDMQFGPQTFSDIKFDDFYGQQPSSYGAYFPLRMAMGAFSDIIGTESVEKLLLFSILLICGLSMHFSLPKEHGNARYLAGLLYMLNPFVYVRFLAGHWSFLLSYSVWPFALLSFWQFLEKPKERMSLVQTALLVALASISSHGVIILLICFTLMLVFHLLKNGFERVLGFRLALLAAVVLAMNLYWILPTIMLFEKTYSPASPEAYFEDFKPQGMGMSLGASLISMHGFWRGGFIYTKDIFALWWVPFLIILAVASMGFVALLRERALYALFLLSLLIVGFLLALGESSPFSWVFTSLGKQFPIYLLFRDSQKFVGMICLGYSFLCSYGAHSLMNSRPRWKPVLLALAILVPVILNFGFFGFFGQIRTTQYPADWLEAARIIENDPSETNVLILPPFLYNTYSWSNATQKTLASPAGQVFSKPIIVSQSVMTLHVYSDIKDSYGSYLTYLFDKRQFINNTAELLVPLNVGYIVVLKEYSDSDSYLWLFKRKGGVKDIELIYEGESLYLFRNNIAAGPFLSTDDYGNASFTRFLKADGGVPDVAAVEYSRINPATYRITGSASPYLVYVSPPDPTVRFGDSTGSPWYKLGNVFEYREPGILTNAMFPIVLAFFLLAWLVALILISNPPAPATALLAFFLALSSLPIMDGTLGPHGIGALLVITVSIALIVSYYVDLSKACKSFLKLK
jgi:hypothetical protein